MTTTVLRELSWVLHLSRSAQFVPPHASYSAYWSGQRFIQLSCIYFVPCLGFGKCTSRTFNQRIFFVYELVIADAYLLEQPDISALHQFGHRAVLRQKLNRNAVKQRPTAPTLTWSRLETWCEKWKSLTVLEALAELDERVEGQRGDLRLAPTRGVLLDDLFVLDPARVLHPLLVFRAEHVQLCDDLWGTSKIPVTQQKPSRV